jgi:hypothetical protein
MTIPSRIYACHQGHPNDQLYAENIVEFCDLVGMPARAIQMANAGSREELRVCMENPGGRVIGFNSQLDHAWIGSEPFLPLARRCGLSVVQWLLDHPSCRWPSFNTSTIDNSFYLFHSAYSERYFRRYCLPNATTSWAFGVGRNRWSRVTDFNRSTFLDRDILCLIPANVNRVGGGIAENTDRMHALGAELSRVLCEAFTLAKHDLIHPVEEHLLSVLADYNKQISVELLHKCVQILEDSIQTYRRTYVFGVARQFPVLIQTDTPGLAYARGSVAEARQNVGMELTLRRTVAARAVVSINHLNDMIHDRTLNALSAGCVNIVEDNIIHRALFKDGSTALFFRYDDDSLQHCLDLVCNRTKEAYRIAEAGIALRDEQPFLFGGFHHLITLGIGSASGLASQRSTPAVRPHRSVVTVPMFV